MAVWKFRDPDVYAEAKRMLSEAEYADQMGHRDERERLVDALRSMPGYPRHVIGEHVDLVLERRTLVLPSGATLRRKDAAILDVRRSS